MAFPKLKIADDDGNVADVTSNRLDVNAYLSATPTIDIGDVSLLLGGTAASVNAGAVGAQTLRVTLASNDPAVTALQIIDNAVHVDDAAFTLGSSSGVMMMGFNGSQSVNTNDAAALTCDSNGYLNIRIQGGTTIVSEIEEEVTINDGGNTITVDNGGTFAVQSTLQAGSAAIGKLTANSGVDIGDEDVTSISAGTNAIGKVGHDITGGADGVTTVTTAGSHVELASSTACKKVDIQAQTDNTGLIAVGFTGVDATEATGTGVILYAGDAYSLEISNLNLIYIDSTVSGEGVRYTYFT